MGNASCTDMSAVPQRCSRSHCQPILYHHAFMVSSHVCLNAPSLCVITNTAILPFVFPCRSWPTPVMLKQIEDGPLHVRVWNPKVSQLCMVWALDCSVIGVLAALSLGSSTPNADHYARLSFHVRNAQRDVFNTNDYDTRIQDRCVDTSIKTLVRCRSFPPFDRVVGGDIVNNVFSGAGNWSDLFAKHDFFHKYRHYLQVVASTGTPEQHVKWYVTSPHGFRYPIFMYGNNEWHVWFDDRSGTVESRIRQLIMKLEYVDTLTLAHPFIKGFEQVHHCLTSDEVHACANGEISDVVAKRKKEDIEGKEGASTVYSTTFYIGLAIELKQGASLNATDVYWLDLMGEECELTLIWGFLLSSRFCFYFLSWINCTEEARYLVSHIRVHKVGEVVGEI